MWFVKNIEYRVLQVDKLEIWVTDSDVPGTWFTLTLFYFHFGNDSIQFSDVMLKSFLNSFAESWLSFELWHLKNLAERLVDHFEQISPDVHLLVLLDIVLSQFRHVLSFKRREKSFYLAKNLLQWLFSTERCEVLLAWLAFYLTVGRA